MELSKTRISRLALLRHKKYREREGLFIVQGVKAVKDTLGEYELDSIIIKKGFQGDFSIDPEKTFVADEASIRKISTLDNPPEIMAVFRIPEWGGTLKPDCNTFTLALDGVQDPGNMGTIVRTAHWFGIKKIFCSLDCVDIYNPKVVLATMGSLAKIKIYYCDLVNLLDENPDIPVYGLQLNGENLFQQRDLPPGIIVMGSEGQGIRKTLKERITLSLTIPPASLADHPESLNVSIATAITIAQLVK